LEENASSQVLDHLGLVASVIKDLVFMPLYFAYAGFLGK